jgi:acyl transferase domain-containing protein
VLEAATPPEPSPPGRTKQLLVLSARTPEELESAKARLADWLDARPSLSAGAFADVAYTLAVGRPHFGYRWAGAFDSPVEAAAALREPACATRPTARQVLFVQGEPRELVAMIARAVADDPLLREVFATLVGAGLPGRGETRDASLLDQLPAETGAALGVTAAARALSMLGCSFARIDAPAWLTPATRWLGRGAPLEDLPEALAACIVGDDQTAGARSGEAPSDGFHGVVVGPAFELSAAAGRLWSLGTSIDWQSYYAGEARRRTSLPSYPFTRQRFWLEKVDARRDVGAGAATSDGRAAVAEDADRALSDIVQDVWCETLGRDDIEPDAHFVDDLDGDSMYAAEIGARLNELVDAELPVDLPFVAPTIAETVRYIEEAQAAEVAT